MIHRNSRKLATQRPKKWNNEKRKEDEINAANAYSYAVPLNETNDQTNLVLKKEWKMKKCKAEEMYQQIAVVCSIGCPQSHHSLRIFDSLSTCNGSGEI